MKTGTFFEWIFLFFHHLRYFLKPWYYIECHETYNNPCIMYLLITKNWLVCIYFLGGFYPHDRAWSRWNRSASMAPEGWQSSRQLLFIPRIKTWQTQTSPQPLFYTSSPYFSLAFYVRVTFSSIWRKSTDLSRLRLFYSFLSTIPLLWIYNRLLRLSNLSRLSASTSLSTSTL